jgi:ketosteroid isomerase-like protein
MSQENVELARKGYEAFNRRDADALADLCDPEVEFLSLIAESEGQVYRGHEGVRAFLRQQDEAFDAISAEIEEIIDFDDFLIISLCFRAHGRESGVPVEQHSWQAARIRANRILWWKFFRTRAEALEAAGLSE